MDTIRPFSEYRASKPAARCLEGIFPIMMTCGVLYRKCAWILGKVTDFPRRSISISCTIMYNQIVIVTK